MIHQVLVSASFGDAITNEALEIQKLLSTMGPSRLFARFIDPKLEGTFESLTEFDSTDPNATILYHASIGEKPVHEFLMSRPERLAILYHNISPAESFEPYEPEFARLLVEGREQLSELRPRVDMALADSTFNADDLRAMGYDEVRVTPLIIDPQRLLSVPPDEDPREPGLDADYPVLLYVGQLLPHKRLDFLINTFNILSTYLMPEPHLVIVGPSRLRNFALTLQAYVGQLGLDNVHFMSHVSEWKLAEWYRKAALFVTMSEHEGFCVPLLEAMAFDVPVLARRAGAIPETASDGALLLDMSDPPAVAAEAMARLLEDSHLRKELVLAGRERLAIHAPERTRDVFFQNIKEFAGR